MEVEKKKKKHKKKKHSSSEVSVEGPLLSKFWPMIKTPCTTIRDPSHFGLW